jgi:hypothetical protein
VAVAREASIDLLDRLRSVEPRFAAMPELDPRDAPTSFRVRGRDLRVDFLTTVRRRARRKPVPLSHLNVAAQPMEGLDYLIETPPQAVVVGGNGVLVNVPLPARYALENYGWRGPGRCPSSRRRARTSPMRDN